MLEFLIHGYSPQNIASKLSNTEDAVRKAISRMHDKTGCYSTYRLCALYAAWSVHAGAWTIGQLEPKQVRSLNWSPRLVKEVKIQPDEASEK